MKELKPYRIEVAQEQIDDLGARLGMTRWPEKETPDDWSQGVPLAWMQDIASHWRNHYDWRRTEARINRWPQYIAAIDGLDFHVLHARSSHAHALPLVMTHGWPGSIVEFLEVIEPLTEPQRHGGDARDAFHVVCPSLPGYGFSAKPAAPGWGVERIARAWAALMAQLGYQRYVAQGGDWGAAVTTALAPIDPDHCAAIHLNMPTARPDRDTMNDLTAAEQRALDDLKIHRDWGTGYSTQQRTRPQTLGYGLVDSPVGQAAWILEKFWAWTDCDGHPENVLTRDQLLDNVMLYWLTGSGASSARLYWESFAGGNLDEITTPTGCSIFPREIFRCSRRWIEKRFTNLIYFNEPGKGGHFAAFEQPELFVAELRSCFATMRG
jgi:pimeloyl-ACP methyl ester carboxylesterase